jgi:protein kinase C substrate 80K-H
MQRVVLAVLMLLCTARQLVHGKLLGVQNAYVSHYDAAEASQTFQCLDGSKTIPFFAVNDDVCDCPDGSDEPGTPACVTLRNGVVAQLPKDWLFQCTNQGFFEQRLPHSRVNDGICDCCDGSDELGSGVLCPNRCVEVEGELARQLEEERKRMQSAAANKAAMTEEIMKRREVLRVALPGQKAEHGKLLDELPVLEEKNNTLQKSLESVREELRVKYDEWEAAKAERETAGATEDESSCIKWRQTGKCKGDGPRERDRDKDCNAIIPGKDSGYCECATQDAEDASLNDGDDEGGADVGEESTVKYEFSCGHPDFTCMHVCDNNGEAAVDAIHQEPQHPRSYTTPEATAAEEALISLRKKLAELENTIAETEKVLNTTVPSTEELLRTLEGKTFEMDFQDYTYAVTMFKNVHQRNKGEQSGGTLLGMWKSFAENTYAMWAKDAYDLTQMLYDGGMRCWNGVTRKVDIQLVCGPENKLTHIEEPAMCIYRMVFETPALCDD